jgi:hypothetical protein
MKLKRKITYKPTPILFIIILFLIVITFFPYYSNHSYYDSSIKVSNIFNYIFLCVMCIELELVLGIKVDYRGKQ